MMSSDVKITALVYDNIARQLGEGPEQREVERLRIALADAMGAPHTLTVDEIVEWVKELVDEFHKAATECADLRRRVVDVRRWLDNPQDLSSAGQLYQIRAVVEGRVA
jgi:hypothetical protein